MKKTLTEQLYLEAKKLYGRPAGRPWISFLKRMGGRLLIAATLLAFIFLFWVYFLVMKGGI